MRTSLLIVIGMVLGALAVGVVWASTAGDVTVRVVGERHADGRVEVSLQQRGSDGVWIDLERPELRFVPAHAEVGERLHSSPIVVPVETQAERVASDYDAYLFESGNEAGTAYRNFLAPDGSEPGPFLCVIDLNDEGVDRICDGVEASYGGVVERIASQDLGELHSQLVARLSAEERPAILMATSVPAVLVAIEARAAAGLDQLALPMSYWIELVNPLLPDRENLYCQISHGGWYFFWGVASESATAAAGALNINLRDERHFDGQDQANAIRQCIDDGAVTIATTLAEPETIAPAVDEARAAGIPVLSFNSGASAAKSVGSAIHIGLDDPQAGRLAGTEFNDRGVEGLALCIVHEPNNTGLHERCQGLEDTYDGEVASWSATSAETYVSELTERLSSGDVGAILTLSVVEYSNVARVQELAELEIPIATFGWSAGIAERVADGSVMFTILDHPEVQAYLTTAASLMIERFRLDPSAFFSGMNLLIQPTIIDAEQMQALLATLSHDPERS